MPRIRENITDLSVGTDVISAEQEDETIIRYFNRNDDYGILKDALELAYDVGIEDIVLDGGDVIETYGGGGREFRKKLETGEIDALNIGWGHKIANAKATLFTEAGLRFSLVHESGDTDVKEAESVLNNHRKRGSFIAQMVSANRVAVFRGCCLVLVSYLRNSLRYRKIYPGQIRVRWGETVVENDRERPTDTLDIEDASVVLIRLGQVGIDKYAYLGIVPSNPQVPYGRYVTFVDSLTCQEIPQVGEPGAIDYRLDDGDKEGGVLGTPVNPLSYFALQHPERDIPEIPLAVMLGGTTDAEVLCPTFRTLYEQSLIFDKKTSHILDKADEKAAGTLVVERTHEANGQPLPPRLTGSVALQQGQTIQDVAHDATACDIAHNIKRMDMIDTAASYSVPDFMVISEDHTVDASSGRALDIKARPLKKDRKNLIDLNGPCVDRVFELERATLEFMEDEDPGVLDILSQCRQEWEAGPLALPEDKNEVATRIISLGNAGVMDTIAQIMEYYHLPSDEDAVELYKSMAKRKKQFPPLNQEEKEKEKALGAKTAFGGPPSKNK
jgi:hypothetical protein